DAVQVRLLPDLRGDLPDVQLVKLVGEHDGRVREARLVEHLGRLDAQVCEVAGVEADANGLVPLSPQFLENCDRVRDAAFQRVDGIHEQQRVVGVYRGVGA